MVDFTSLGARHEFGRGLVRGSITRTMDGGSMLMASLDLGKLILSSYFGERFPTATAKLELRNAHAATRAGSR